MSTLSDSEFSRRRFLGAAGGLVIGFTLPVLTQVDVYARERPGALPFGRRNGPAGASPSVAPSQVTGWVRVAPNETVTLAFGGAEMGQGASTGLAQALAEELRVDWSAVRIEASPVGLSYITGGSTAIRLQLDAMRKAGAQAREMLIAAAAKSWGVTKSQCTAAHGIVTNDLTQEAMTYGALAAVAANMPAPADPPLTPQGQWHILGHSVRRLDIPPKTNGSAVYGIDVQVPNLVFAAVRHGPAFGATLKGTPPKPAGAIALVPLDDAFAVVADNTWKAMQLSREVNARWTIPASATSNSTAAIRAKARSLMANGTPIVAERTGNAARQIGAAATTVIATYELPYLAHAYMEVLNCTVKLSAKTCEIWVPTQAPSWVVATAAAITGLPPEKITVHVTLTGGGLGRKIEQDYVAQAVRVAKAVGRPVKLTWPREEDFGRDQYRPTALARVTAGLDGSGNVTGWHQRIVTPSILFQRGWVGPTDVDSSAVDGAIGLPYDVGARLVEFVRHPATIPVGFWRSVGQSINVFVVESMIDELAHAAGVDPLAFRRRMLPSGSRERGVLDAAAALGKWGSKAPAGRARGIAMGYGFGSIVGEVAEVSRISGGMRVHRVAVAIDCGTAVNPGQVIAQAQGGVAHGLSAALWGEITFTNGASDVRNFNRYRVVRLADMPSVDVKIIESGAAIGGIGEVAVPPLAPAVANAWFALTGQRVRSLPFFPGARMGDG